MESRELGKVLIEVMIREWDFKPNSHRSYIQKTKKHEIPVVILHQRYVPKIAEDWFIKEVRNINLT